METIISKDGRVIARSMNLRGQLERAGRIGVDSVDVARIGATMGAVVATAFPDGSHCETQWASFDTAVEFYRRRLHLRNSAYHGLRIVTDTETRFTIDAAPMPPASPAKDGDS
jgi:hypothetical protein